MAMWNPWRGCHRHSEGCKYCYIHKGDAKRGVDTDHIVQTGKLDVPIAKYQKGARKGEYKIPPGETVYLCFSSDFLLPDADPWRPACWDIIRQRPDLRFLFLTKRIERFAACVPEDWGAGYENVTVGCTVENQETADFRLSILDALPIPHKNIICQPLLERIDIEKHLSGVELVVVGGESDRCARTLDYEWVLFLREQCVRSGARFQFRQCGSNFLKDGTLYHLNVAQLCAQARKANLDT